jgi:hypothetical protein
MRAPRWLVVALALAALAAAGVGANLYLLGLTQDSGEPVGRLSPRAVFPTTTTPPGTVTPPTQTTSTDDHGGHDGQGHPDD